MDSKVCVTCDNKNAVNETDNRLVTESCGHVKCMQCLLQETAGCVACNKEEKLCKPGDSSILKTEPERKRAKLERTGRVEDTEASLDSEAGPDRDDNVLQTGTLVVEEITEENPGQDNESDSRKNKLCTSHVITATDGHSEWYICTLCRRKFSARSQVAYHAYCNGQKKPFECRECKRRFATHSHYNYHMQSKHPTNCRGRYICEVCDASFIQKSKLQRHKLIKHTKEKKYSCKECGKAFNNACSLRKHGLLHSGERPYMCPHCPRLFRDSSNLKKHIHNKHGSSEKSRSPASQSTGSQESAEGETQLLALSGRKHQCPRCPQAFHSRKDLRRHESVHTEQKPFECPIRDMKCKQPRFRRRDNFNRHLRNTHGLLVSVAVSGSYSPSGQNGTALENAVEKDEVREKAKLEVLNPLPPLPEEVIQKHLYTEDKTDEERTIDNELPPKTTEKSEPAIDKKLDKIVDKGEVQVIEKCEGRELDKNVEKPVIDKSKIIEANNARESVIVGTVQEKRAPSPVPAYVHKIRKANSLSCQKEVCLPPIDTRKLVELVTLYPHSKEEPRSLDVGPLRVKDVQTLKNILHDKVDKHGEDVPTVHWRKKRLTDNE